MLTFALGICGAVLAGAIYVLSGSGAAVDVATGAVLVLVGGITGLAVARLIYQENKLYPWLVATVVRLVLVLGLLLAVLAIKPDLANMAFIVAVVILYQCALGVDAALFLPK